MTAFAVTPTPVPTAILPASSLDSTRISASCPPERSAEFIFATSSAEVYLLTMSVNGRGVFKRVWRLLLKEYEELRGIQWRWQALDSATTKAPLGGEAAGKSPVDRGKLGTKRHVLTDQRGAPIGLEVTGANRHDSRAA